MKVKTITGSSIHAALVEARRLLGDDVVLLESIAGTDTEPARITVMAETSTSKPEKALVAASESPAPALTGYGYGAVSRANNGVQAKEESARASESFSTKLADLGQALEAQRLIAERKRAQKTVNPVQAEPEGIQPQPKPTRSPGRGRLFPEVPGSIPPANPEPTPNPSTERLEKLFEAQLKMLHDRLDQMERRFSASLIGSSQMWVTHPLFSGLLDRGMHPATVTKLFESLAEKGYDIQTDPAKLQWVLAHELREQISVPVSRQTVGTQVFIGPSGAGKTSLILKLATHPNFFARRNTTIITILPEEDGSFPYQNPVDLYRSYGVPVQSVRSEEEMAEAISRLNNFDQVLIDTPSLPLHEGRARRMLQRIRRLVDPLVPFEVQFVLNTTRALDGFQPEYLKRLPLAPNAVALTHLDETPGWGRIAEWLIKLKQPVQFISVGQTTEDLASFSPSWFVEKMMEL